MILFDIVEMSSPEVKNGTRVAIPIRGGIAN
jgi:hypothetical protein